MSKDWQVGHGNFDPYDNVPPLPYVKSAFETRHLLEELRTAERNESMDYEKISKDLEKLLDRRVNVQTMLDLIKNRDYLNGVKMGFWAQYGVGSDETEVWIDLFERDGDRNRGIDYLSQEMEDVQDAIEAKQREEAPFKLAQGILYTASFLTDETLPFDDFRDELLKLRSKIDELCNRPRYRHGADDYDRISEHPVRINTGTNLGGEENEDS